ncbi:MAG: phosphate ABC transporter permease PstA [Alphaproteobacteria bacterium]
MSDLALTPGRRTVDWTSSTMADRVKSRRRSDLGLQVVGIGAIAIALGLLGTLLVSLTVIGYQAFTQTHLDLTVTLPDSEFSPDAPLRGDYDGALDEALFALFPDVTERRDRRAVSSILSSAAGNLLRQRVVQDPSLIGEPFTLRLPVSDTFDQLHKKAVNRDAPENQRRVSDRQIGWFDSLEERGLISRPFNTRLFTAPDSRYPEIAGLAGALTGSFLALLVCFLISFPLGIAAAIHLEEFAPRNRWTDLIEVNVNNLAAVPSIVFGLLGLAVFLQFVGLPRSAPLVGGMVLSLMTLPTIIIATRASLKAVAPSIREAALGVGASKHQTVFDHVLPSAMPGILTGTIIGLAQALGETAPLLLIGMNAFIPALPDGLMEPATALPTQIFIWADSPERGFVQRTAAGILVLLGFLLVMNALAIGLRQWLQKRT